MNEIFTYFVESILCLGLFYAYYKLLIEKGNLLNFSRFYLLSTSAFSVLFPIIKINLPSVAFTVNRITSGFLIRLDQVIVTGNNAMISDHSSLSWTHVILGIYISGIAITAVLFIIKLLSLFHFIRKNKVEKSGKYSFLFNQTGYLSFSFFHYIFLGECGELTEYDKLRILEHEKAHVDQKHSFDSIYFEILSIIFWFNPFIWLYRRLIVDTHEYLADSAVIKRTGPEGYTRLLVQQVIGMSGWQLANYFKNSNTLKRIKKMKTYAKKSNKIIIALFLPVVLIIFLIISCRDKSQKLKDTKDDKIAGQSATGDSSAIAENQKKQLEKSIAPIDSLSNKVYRIVEVQPEFKGGMNEYKTFIVNNIKYPETAKNHGIQGRVFVQFIIDKEGNVKNAKVLKGFNPECDKEAVRVVSMMPPWKPGIKDGQPVSVYFVLPILFSLEKRSRKRGCLKSLAVVVQSESMESQVNEY